ncbi:hypothetical protein GOP47_0003932 [Adiantum capillus-veneris]|uniref:Pentatricopeptide repeat-containing protein n=1 Tax=Adiantum capillus-veneris TaxID=13818 RepID=A0A9D4V736_ADICA|nr:hypothetical protein GOP47_0003932 [Adiantum capillus-veneris]
MRTIAVRTCVRRASDPEVLTWNLIMGASVQSGQSHEALQMFNDMQNQGFLPDRVTLVTIISACAKCPSLRHGKCIHAIFPFTLYYPDVTIGTALLSMYGKCGSIQHTLHAFDLMPIKNAVTYNAVISSCVHVGDIKQACRFLHLMQSEDLPPSRINFLTILKECSGKLDLKEGRWLHDWIVRHGLFSDLALATLLVIMYGECNCLEDAKRIFDMLPTRDVVLWSSMMVLVSRLKSGAQAQQMFEQMKQECVMPDIVMYTSVIDASAVEGTIYEGRRVHACILQMGSSLNVVASTSMINMYGKCGDIHSAVDVFDAITQPNVVSWNSMLGMYAHVGDFRNSLQLFNNMQQEGAMPNHVTFTIILDSCANITALKEGKQLHVVLINYGLDGRLDDAEELINRAPHVPTAVTWTALLGSCRNEVDVERGERAAISMLKTDPEESASYTSLSNVYFAAGRNEDGARLMQQMKEVVTIQSLQKTRKLAGSILIFPCVYYSDHFCIQLFLTTSNLKHSNRQAEICVSLKKAIYQQGCVNGVRGMQGALKAGSKSEGMHWNFKSVIHTEAMQGGGAACASAGVAVFNRFPALDLLT